MVSDPGQAQGATGAKAQSWEVGWAFGGSAGHRGGGLEGGFSLPGQGPWFHPESRRESLKGSKWREADPSNQVPGRQ